MMETGLKQMLAFVLFGLVLDVFAAEKITLMVSGIDKLIYLPAKLAEELGYFGETGLDVELLSEPAGSNAETEMLSGVAHGVVGFYDHTVSLQARGQRVQSVIQLAHAPGEAILASRAGGIERVADFKGRTLGVTGLGSSTYHLMRYIAFRAGLKPADYRLLPVGAGDSFIAAMARGEIGAGMTTEPTISSLLSTDSATVLVDLRTMETTRAVLGGSYPGACLYLPTAWIGRHREEVRKIVGAFLKALQYIQTHSGEEIAELMPKEFHGASRRLYAQAIEEGKRMFTADGIMPADGPATVLEVLSVSDRSLQGKSINLSNTFTARFLAPEGE
jgi:NitT/TauT family transport system substrate-binding protein